MAYDFDYHSIKVHYRVNRNGRRGTLRQRYVTVRGPGSETSAVSAIRKYEKINPQTDEIIVEAIEPGYK